LTLSSFSAMMAFADFGIGNGVLTSVARASGKDDVALMRMQVSNGFALLGGIALALILFAPIFYPFIDYPALFNVRSSLARAEAGAAFAAFIACFALMLPLAIVQRVQ